MSAEPIPVETVNILLDSKFGTRTSTGYSFDLGHNVTLDNNETGTVYVSDFYCINGLLNTPNSCSFVITVAGVSNTVTITGNKNFKDRQVLIDDVIDVLPAGFTIAYDDTIKKAIISHPTEQFSITDEGIDAAHDSLSKKLGILTGISVVTTGTTNEMKSADVIDLNVGVHNLYISIREITNTNRTLASGIQRNDVINRIPILQNFGDPIIFDASNPLSLYKFTARNLNRLTVTLTDDENRVYIPNRMTMGIKIQKFYHNQTLMKDKILEEIYKKMVDERKKYNHVNIATDKDHPIQEELCVLPNPQKDDVSIGAVRENKWWMGAGSVPYN